MRMGWKSAVGLALALFVASLTLAPLFTPIGDKNKDFRTTSSSYPLEMNNLSAEEINRRTLKAAAAIKSSTK
jgi:hypothetical protein